MCYENNDIIREEFVSFLECKNDLIGVVYLNVFLGSEVLDILDCCGKRYAGAGAVVGKDKALQVIIPRINPKPFC